MDLNLLSQEEIQIPIKYSSGVEYKTVPAHVYGLWAVHKRDGYDRQWTLSHIVSGFAAKHFDSFEEACEAMEFMSSLANDFNRLADDHEFWRGIGEKFSERYKVPSLRNNAPEDYEHNALNGDLVGRAQS